MSKRIRLTVEYNGPEGESTYAAILRDTIEGDDVFGTTLVSEVELLTDEGSQVIPATPLCASPL